MKSTAPLIPGSPDAEYAEKQALQAKLAGLKERLQAGLGAAREQQTRAAKLEQLTAASRYYEAALYCLDEQYAQPLRLRLLRTAKYLQLGYKNQCKNCALRLCECFLHGYGVEKNPWLAAAIADSLSASGFHAARYYSYYLAKLGLGSGDGCGSDELEKHAQIFEQHCYKPQQGLSEELRLELLCKWSLLQQRHGWQELFIAVDYVRHSAVFYRYSLYFKLLLPFCQHNNFEDVCLEACLFAGSRIGDESLLVRQALRFAAQAGDKKFDVAANYAISPEHLQRLSRKIWAGSFNAGQRAALLHSAAFVPQQHELEQKCLELFWKRTRLGASGLAAQQRLPVGMKLLAKAVGSYFHVCHQQVANELLEQQGLDSLLVRGLPLLVLHNESSAALGNLRLKVSCAQSGRSVSKDLEIELAAGETYELELEPLRLELGNEVFFELSCGEQKTHLHVYGKYGMDALALREYITPMLLFWRYDWKGARKLYCNTLNSDVEQVRFHDRSGSLSNATDMLAECVYGPIGKGVAGLKKDFRPDTDYFITSGNFAGVGFRILPTPADSSLSELPQMQPQRHYQLAAILAIFFGLCGAHKFYHRSWLWGIVYVLLAWSGLSLLAGIIEGLYYLADPDKYHLKYNMRANHAWRW